MNNEPEIEEELESKIEASEGDGEGEVSSEAGDDALSIPSFGDEEDDDDSAPDLPKRLRGEIKERDRELAVARRRLEELESKSAPAPIDVGEKPTREQFDWDEDAYDAAVEEYNERRIQAAIQEKQAGGADDEVRSSVEQKLNTYQASLAALPFPDAETITTQTREALSQQAHFNIVSAVKDPATFIYALGKNPAKLQALASIKNPAEQIAEAARMEVGMKTGRSKAPAPDKPLSGNKSAAVNVDKEEARLEKEADRTGNRTDLIKYRKAKKAA